MSVEAMLPRKIREPKNIDEVADMMAKFFGQHIPKAETRRNTLRKLWWDMRDRIERMPEQPQRRKR